MLRLFRIWNQSQSTVILGSIGKEHSEFLQFVSFYWLGWCFDLTVSTEFVFVVIFCEGFLISNDNEHKFWGGFFCSDDQTFGFCNSFVFVLNFFWLRIKHSSFVSITGVTAELLYIKMKNYRNFFEFCSFITMCSIAICSAEHPIRKLDDLFIVNIRENKCWRL